MLLGKFEFIGIWIGIKLAGHWIWEKDIEQQGENNNPPETLIRLKNCLEENKSDEASDKDKQDDGEPTPPSNAPTRFKNFLIGNALTIICSAVMYALIKAYVIAP